MSRHLPATLCCLACPAVLLLVAGPTTPACAAADGVWGSLDGITARASFSMVYDAPRARAVIFGGRGSGATQLDDVWALDPASGALTAIDPVTDPPAPRGGQATALDELRHRMVVIGGADAVTLGDVWTLTLGAAARWDSIPVGGGPGPRQLATAVYDPPRDRVIVFGGLDATPTPQSDVWSLTLGDTPAWSPLAPAGPGPVASYGHAAVYDPVRDRMLCFVRGDTAEVWSLTLGAAPAWTRLATAGSSPGFRYGAVLVYDASGDRLVLHGGIDPASNYLDDTWALSLSGTPTWSYLTRIDFPPNGRSFACGIYDPLGQQMVMFGGNYWNGIPPARVVRTGYALSMAPFSTWQQLVTLPPAHVARSYAASAYDPGRRQWLLFGGAVSATTDVDVLDLSGAPVWSHVAFASPPPSPAGASAVFDAARDRLLVFGGLSGVTYSNTVYALDRAGGSWSTLAVAGVPPGPRRDASLVLDATNDRLLLYGGRDGAGSFADVWEMSLGASPAWTRLTAAAPPGARCGHSAVIDAIGARMLVFGGAPGATGPVLGDLWSMPLAAPNTWVALATSGAAPAARRFHGAAIDAARHRMLVYGGEAGGVPFADLVALDTNSLAWRTLSPDGLPPAARAAASVAWLPQFDRLLIADGQGASGMLGDAWSFDPFSLVGVAVVNDPRPSLALAPPRPDPAREWVEFTFERPAGGAARLEVFDLAGRRLRTLEAGAQAAGRGALRWDLRAEDGVRVGAGLYLARLTTAIGAATRRFVVLR